MYSPKIELDFERANRGFVNIGIATKTAARNTLNVMGYLTRKNAIKKVNENFIIRNKFTQSQIRVDPIKDKRLSINTMQVSVGATDKADYLERQEKGGQHRPKVGGRLAIAQTDARGGSNKRVVLSRYFMSNINKKMIKGGRYKRAKTFRSKLVAKASVAAGQGSSKSNSFIFYGKSIFQVTSFYKVGNRTRFVKKFIHFMGKRVTRTPASPWLEPSTVQPVRDAQNIFNSQIDKLLKQKII